MDTSHLIEQAGEHYRAGRFHEAEVTFRKLLAADPNLAEAWHGLGLIALAAGQRPAALDCLRRAAALQPGNARFTADLRRFQQSDDPEASRLNNAGIAAAKVGNWPEALAAFQRATQLRPDHASAHNNLGNVLKHLGRFDEALRAISQAVRLTPGAADLHVNLGHLLRQLGRLADAEGRFRHALQLEPGHLDALKPLASTLFDGGRAEEALEVFRQVLARTPDDAEVLNDLGNVLRQLERHDEAVPCYERAVRLRPDLGSAHANLANLRSEEGRTEEARELYRQAHRLRPSPLLRILSETQLPVIYQSMGQMAEVRARLTEDLRRLDAEGVRLDPTQEMMPTHFYLAYQGMNDRELHAAFARLGDGSRSEAARQTKCGVNQTDGPRRLGLPDPRPRTGGKIRVGFLSKYLRTHTIGQLNHGLIAGLSREQFEVTVISVGPPDEGLGRRIRQSADRFLVLPPQLGAALQTVAGLGLDVLYYPDVGMDSLTYTMAFSRLAPVQCATWGHPVTTGLPTIDYFVSSEDLESPGSDDQYTEKLVRLPRLGVCYERPELPAVRKGRAAFGLPESAHVYLCPQTLFKFHPEIDDLFGGILRRDPAGLLVLIEGKYPHWTELLRQRFARTLPDVLDRIVFVPKQGRGDFLNLLAVADVMLDPIHFGGGNTSYEGFALGVPIVTWPSGFLRGRLTHAMYRQMGIPDLTARDAAGYIERAVQLGTDPAYREEMSSRIRERSGVLFGDVAAVRAVEAFLASVVKL